MMNVSHVIEDCCDPRIERLITYYGTDEIDPVSSCVAQDYHPVYIIENDETVEQRRVM
jgi:hypothetical protein